MSDGMKTVNLIEEVLGYECSVDDAITIETMMFKNMRTEIERLTAELAETRETRNALADFGQTYKKLTDLLCRIHRDGGQAIGKYGVDKAYVDAVKIVLQTFDRAEQAEAELARYKQGVEVEDFVNRYGVLEAEYELRPELWGKRVRVLVMKVEE